MYKYWNFSAILSSKKYLQIKLYGKCEKIIKIWELILYN